MDKFDSERRAAAYEALRQIAEEHGSARDAVQKIISNEREARRAFALEMAVQLVAKRVEKTGIYPGAEAATVLTIARELERYLTEEGQ